MKSKIIFIFTLTCVLLGFFILYQIYFGEADFQRLGKIKDYNPTENFETVNEDARAYTISLPEGWIEIPREILEQKNNLVIDLTGEDRVPFDYGYQSTSAEYWFDAPHIAVRIIRNGKIPENLLNTEFEQHFEQGLEEDSKSLDKNLFSDFELGETYYEPSLHTLWTRVNMNIDGQDLGILTAMILTEYGHIRFITYTPISEYSTYKPVYRAMVRSIKFSEADTYKPEVSDNDS